ncbi:MAG: aspartate aminotransferase family protein [Thermaerobacter sp.]|nr:aspartate aminotransferase family protein [Thermaerobacter sp.]
MSEESLLDRQRRYLVPAVAPYYQEPLLLESGSGRTVTDQAGQSYLDFFGGILTVSIGHAHPAVAEAVADQARKLVHTSTLYVTKPMVDLAEKLASLLPGELSQSFFTTSGTEANETAITMAQIATGRPEIVALRHSYSGRSQLGMGLTGQSGWKLGEGGQSLPIHHAHNAYCYRCPFGRTPDACGLECAHDLEEFIQTSTGGRIAAFIAEPIQGVGGFITPPPAFFQEAVGIVRKHGGLFIDDEVQTGFGRTGSWFGIEQYGVTPDIMTFAKGLGNGLPVGATVTTPDIARGYRGPTISTFGGNPLSMRAALATLAVIEREGLVTHTRNMGDRLRSGLEELSDRYPVLGDVRGKGLMQGLELVRRDKAPAPDLTTRLVEESRQRGLLIGKGGLYGNAVRIAPPMTVTATEIDEALAAMEGALRAVYQSEPDLKAVTPTRIRYEAALS